jgi:outer membrane biosynthesis protein TonB
VIDLPQERRFELPPPPDIAGIDQTQIFQWTIHRKIEEKKQYPLVARKRSLEGSVVLKFLLNSVVTRL